MDHKTEQDAGLLEQAATMLEEHAEEQRTRGNCSAAEGAACSAHAIRRLAPALLRAGHGCLAQPVCWIRFCSDGSTEGPIMHSRICEVRKTSGAWTPLYAGAAPAAVAGPAIDRAATLAAIDDISEPSWTGYECPNTWADGLSAARAVVQSAPAAPALEAPAAPARIVADALIRLDAIYREEADCDEPPQRPDWLATALRLAAAAPQAPAAPAVDAETIHLQDLKNALAECQELRQQLTLMDEQQDGSIWRWQADDQDQIETMGNRMGVLIYACDLRALLARAAPAVDAASDTALLDAMQRHRISLVPEFEGPWDAEIFNDEAEARPIASGNTPREALRAALAAQTKEGGEA